jgi:hypothetical protein
MARLGRAAKGAKRGGKALPDAATPTDTKPAGKSGLPLPSPIAGTNLVIADIVLRAAGGLLRNRMEKGFLIKRYDKAKAEKLVDRRSIASSLALWGASRIATRSPLGLAVVAGGLAAKVFYDRGKRLEGKRRERKLAKPKPDSES